MSAEGWDIASVEEENSVDGRELASFTHMTPVPTHPIRMVAGENTGTSICLRIRRASIQVQELFDLCHLSKALLTCN